MKVLFVCVCVQMFFKPLSCVYLLCISLCSVVVLAHCEVVLPGVQQMQFFIYELPLPTLFAEPATPFTCA